jgi:mannose-6-phosphate isomerase-like protein (cupin superfamily)
MKVSDSVRRLKDDELRAAEGTPGLTRRVAFEGDGHWFGHAQTAPNTMSGWHHHGDNVTMGYVLKGTITFEFGPGGGQKVEVHEGEYFEVPKNTVHREGNSSGEPGEILVSRVGAGQLVFPVDGPDA